MLKNIFVYFIILFFSPFVFAQSSVNVSSDDYQTYRQLDKLISYGLIRDVIVGQRPYSRREVAHMIVEAKEQFLKKQKFSEQQQSMIQSLLEVLSKKFKEDIARYQKDSGAKWNFPYIDQLQVQATLADSPSHLAGLNNGVAAIDANVNPMLHYQAGSHLVNGAYFALESKHHADLGNYVSLFFQPHVELTREWNAGDERSDIYVQELYAKLHFYNFDIQAGRAPLQWGQGKQGGLLLSNNPRPLDMAKVSNDIPFRLPWYFKYLGHHKLSYFYTDLGPEQDFPHSYLTGFKWSLLPARYVELGFAMVINSGGEGSPAGSTWDRIQDIFGFSPFFNQISNKIGGLDLRVRIPQLWGAELYGEAIFDDKHTFEDLHGQFTTDASYLAGLYFPRLDGVGKLDLRLEWQRTGNRFYRHGQFTSGWTLNNFIIGSDLGADAMSFSGEINWDINKQHVLSFKGDFESRSFDQWTHDARLIFTKTLNLPEEKRYRSSLTWNYLIKSNLDLQSTLAYEHVSNFNNVASDSRENFMGSVQLNWHFD